MNIESVVWFNNLLLSSTTGVKLGKVKDIVDNFPYTKDNSLRGGVIPYTIVNKKIYFCLGLDNQHKEYTDFAGGYDIRHDRTPIQTPGRELMEESFSTFTLCEDNKLYDYHCIYAKGIFIVFACYGLDDPNFMESSCEAFKNNMELEKNEKKRKGVTFRPEMIDMKWFTKQELIDLMLTNKVYRKVASVLYPKLEEIVNILIHTTEK